MRTSENFLPTVLFTEQQGSNKVSAVVILSVRCLKTG